MDNEKISGIYKIENKINKKKYIGSSIDILHRWENNHKKELNGNYHHNLHLQNAWRKYGAENFFFTILEDQVEEEDLEPRENCWMTAYESLKREKGYNIRQADRRAPLSEETIKRMSEAQKNKSEEHKRRIGEAHKGKITSEETKKKMSEVHMGKKFSEESRKKMSEAMKGQRRSPVTEFKIGSTPWNKGKTGVYSKETLKKMSEARIGIEPWNKGKTGVYSKETLKKLSEAAKALWHNKIVIKVK